LDEGDVLHQEEFQPIQGVDLDSVFDPWMRAKTLLVAIQKILQNLVVPIPHIPGKGETYYIIHPVLKTFAIRISDKYGKSSKESWNPLIISDYEYTKENRIQNVHKYSFSPFGFDFLQLYHADRNKSLKSIEFKMDQQFPENFSQFDNLVIGCCQTPFSTSTSEILRQLLIKIYQEVPIDEIKKRADPWVKKYEVFKRLYTVYDDKFRKASKDCNEIIAYVLLGLICLKIFEISRNFKFLSTALKISDCVCSVMESISSDPTKVLAWCFLQFERTILSKLAKSLE